MIVRAWRALEGMSRYFRPRDLGRAHALRRAGDLEAARAECARFIARNGGHAQAHHLMGALCGQQGRYADAIEHLERALSLDPALRGVQVDLGNAHRLAGNAAAALACYRNALDLDPDDASACYSLGTMHNSLGDQVQALEYLWRAHRAAPHRGDMLRELVLALLACGRCEEALVAAMTTARLDPGDYQTRICLGLVHHKLYSFDEALDCYDAALQMRQDDPELHFNRAIALQDARRLREALASYDRALALRPDYALARNCRGLARLSQGDYEGGWADYEARLTHKTRPVRAQSYPSWDGTSLSGRTILIYGEQGLGDEIMFASCLPQIIGEAGRCVIECAPKLEGLFARSFPEAVVYAARPDRTIPEAIARDGIDIEVPLGSLPNHLRRSASDFPAHRGYLAPDRGRLSRWRERLSALGAGLKVGVSWRGGTRETRSPLRSIELQQWLPILRTTGVQFVSLQYTAGAADETAALSQRHGVGVVHWPEALSDYDETAALVAALDLTISVCTAVVHLAGALGRPVWVMAPFSPEWRYGAAGARMIWYPSASLFRQAARADWMPVIKTVAGALKGEVARCSSAAPAETRRGIA
jgi:tetratricopeptide (TPR) repeat protein